MAFGGFYRTLSPALSLYDGDLVVVLSSGERKAHVNQIGVLAERAVAEAILVGVGEAEGFGPAGGARPDGRRRLEDLAGQAGERVPSSTGSISTSMKRTRSPRDLWASLLPIAGGAVALAVSSRVPALVRPRRRCRRGCW